MPIKIQRLERYLTGLKVDLLERGTEPKFPITSLPEFNHKIWGFKEQTLTIIAARTSQGKSAFSLQLAYDLAKGGVPTYFISLEMPTHALLERLFCNTQGVDNELLQRGEFALNESYIAKWEAFEKDIKDLPLLITDGIGKTFYEVNTIVSSLDPTPKAVFVDYIQNIKTVGGQTREIINEYLRQFRELAIRKNFIGVLCSQINRGTKDNSGHEPKIWQLKETGNLEEGSDVCILLHWNWWYTHDDLEKHKYKVIVAKNRNGRTGVHTLFFTPQHYQFREYDVFAPQEVEEVKELFDGKVEPF